MALHVVQIRRNVMFVLALIKQACFILRQLLFCDLNQVVQNSDRYTLGVEDNKEMKVLS